MAKGGAAAQLFFLLIFAAVAVAILYFFFRPTQQFGLESPEEAEKIRACENAQIASASCRLSDQVWNSKGYVTLPAGCGLVLKKQASREIICPNPQLPDYCSCGKPPV